MKAVVLNDLIIGFVAFGNPVLPSGTGETVVDLGNISVTPDMALTYSYDSATNTLVQRSVPLTPQQHDDACFYAGASLADAQAYACSQLLANMNSFILYTPTGTIRYDQDFVNSVVTFILTHQPNGLTTAPIPALLAWQQAVASNYFTLKTQIMACTTTAAILAIDISVVGFEAKYGTAGTVTPDPGITTQQLLQ